MQNADKKALRAWCADLTTLVKLLEGADGASPHVIARKIDSLAYGFLRSPSFGTAENPLCLRHLYKRGGCSGCPVALHTGHPLCRQTPLTAAGVELPPLAGYLGGGPVRDPSLLAMRGWLLHHARSGGNAEDQRQVILLLRRQCESLIEFLQMLQTPCPKD